MPLSRCAGSRRRGIYLVGSYLPSGCVHPWIRDVPFQGGDEVPRVCAMLGVLDTQLNSTLHTWIHFVKLRSFGGPSYLYLTRPTTPGRRKGPEVIALLVDNRKLETRALVRTNVVQILFSSTGMSIPYT
jgi:hypothetical protein